MSTLEALNAISEAIQAHAKLPEVERQLKDAREAHDYALLELDEANAKIAELRDTIAQLQNFNANQKDTIEAQQRDIAELRERNTSLDNSLSDTININRNLETIIAERNLQNEALVYQVNTLLAQLNDAKGYGERLAETLRSIGSKIVAAVEVPEVTSDAPFPVSNPVAMSDSSSDQSNDQSSSEPMSVLAEPSAADLVTEPTNAPGCYTSPIPPAKQWWEV